jgi:arsenical pump membrane protein
MGHCRQVHVAALLLSIAGLGAGVTGLVVRRWPVATAAAIATIAGAAAARWFPSDAANDGVQAVLFVAGMVLVAAASERSGLLQWLAGQVTARIRHGIVLLAATFLFAAALTTVCNLDTTAVLFTPLAVVVATSSGQAIAPFAIASILGANFGSMLLPTSNLTNLVVWRRSGETFAEFASRLAPTAIVAVVLTLVVLVMANRRSMQSTPRDHRARPPHDVVLASISGLVVVALVILFFTGVPVGPVSFVAGLALVALRRELWRDRLALELVVAILCVFIAAGLLAEQLDVAAHLAGTAPLGLAITGAALASLCTNLAATLFLEPAAPSHGLQTALLIGVNLGVGFTPVASLATILWRDALRKRGYAVPWRAYLSIAVPLSIVFIALTPLLVPSH